MASKPASPILEKLGKSGMGVVYKAYDPVIEREVATKVILERALDLAEVRERFYREAKSAGRLTHENLTVVHDVGESDGAPFIVTGIFPEPTSGS